MLYYLFYAILLGNHVCILLSIFKLVVVMKKLHREHYNKCLLCLLARKKKPLLSFNMATSLEIAVF